MSLRLTDAEIMGMTDTSVTVAFAVEDDGGAPSDAPATVAVGDGDPVPAPASAGLRLVRVEDLAPDARYTVRVRAGDATFEDTVTTLPAPTARCVATFATVSDLHFGEERWGGVPGIADESLPADYTGTPYWQLMSEDAVADINDAGVDATIVKGDIADTGRAEQFEIARATFEELAAPWHAFLGNHDLYAAAGAPPADGYAILDQPPAPRAVELGGWQLLFLDSVRPGDHRGRLSDEVIAWADETLSASDAPAIVLMHHQAVPPAFARGLINAIGIPPADSVPLFEVVARHRHVRAVLSGHTHRNRVRRYREARDVPFVEVGCTKDYPGAWARYRLFADGSFHQEVRRIGSQRALAHSQRCGRMFDGRYRAYALGALADRCFAVPALT